MRRSILLFLLLILFLSCCGVSFASTDTIILTGPVDYPFLGFRFDPPEAYLNTKGIVTLAGPYETNDIVREVICTYYAMPEDRYDRLFNSGHKSLLEEKDLWSTSIFAVVSMDRGMTFREFCTYTGQPYDEQYVREIGKNGQVRIVTSDNLIQVSALRSGVLRQSAREFGEEIDRIYGDIEQYLRSHNREQLGTVGENIRRKQE